MDMYLYMSWQDDTMKHNGSEHILVNDKEILDKIWLPDLYFANARTAYFHKVSRILISRKNIDFSIF